MNSYRSLIIFLLILLIAAAFWGAIRYFRIYGGDGPAPAPPPEAVTIYINANGFNPAEVTINQGDAVLFINNDTRPHWPASDAHPVHSRCPGFDALRGLTQGETHRSTFTKSQTCSFHDHLNPSLTGIIIIK